MKPLQYYFTLGGLLPILSSSSASAVAAAAALPPAQIPLHVSSLTSFSAAMSSPRDGPAPQIQRSVSIADILGTQRPISSYYTFARQDGAIERLLSSSSSSDDSSSSSSSSNRGGNITVLAPLNSAIDHLPHKPWENPSEYAILGSQAYEGTGGKTRADDNVRRFVEAHIVVLGPTGSWAEGVDAETVGGRTLRWERSSSTGKMVIMPDGVEVDRVASKVSNGEVWVLTGVLNYES